MAGSSKISPPRAFQTLHPPRERGPSALPPGTMVGDSCWHGATGIPANVPISKLNGMAVASKHQENRSQGV